MPMLAKKRVANRNYDTFPITHWVLWLPLKGNRRTTWIKWLWGSEPWYGCGAPRDNNVAQCPVCSQRHGTTVHKHLIQCSKWSAAFNHAWTTSWGPWANYTEEW